MIFVTPRVLEELDTEIVPILALIFQISRESGVVPSDWKTAHVAPVYKKDPKYNPENYRPISLTCMCCKLLELIVVSNVMPHADKYNILYPFQHGFHKFRSCETQLIGFIDDMTRNLDDDQQTDVRIMEFSKALDKVSHNFLTHKLKHYGMRGKVNNWIESFLSGRTQAVIVEGVKSTYPCRFWSAPSMFLYYINDTPTGLDSTIIIIIIIIIILLI